MDLLVNKFVIPYLCALYTDTVQKDMKTSVLTTSTSVQQSHDFASVMQIIETRRNQAVQMVNQASLLTAWEVGAFVSDRIKNAAWGAKVVQQLAEYIHTQDPTLKGWSKITIYRMVKFYETYSSVQFVERAQSLKLITASEDIVSPETAQIVSTPLKQLPNFLLKTSWSNHVEIFTRCSTIDQQIFYIIYAEYVYLEALDQTERRSNENPSIGILMCKDANPEVVRYALNRSMSTTMVSKDEEQIKLGSVLQRSLEEFVDFLDR